MEHPELLVELGAILLALALLSRVANRIGMPTIPLYLTAGLAFGSGGIVPLDITEEFVQAQETYNRSGAVPYHLRTPEQIAGFFEGLELVEPGLVSVPRWRPDPADGEPPAELDAFGAVGRKP